MDNTAQLPVRVQLYWSSAEGQSRGIPAALVADMYCTNVMAHTIVHGWLDDTYIARNGYVFSLGDIMGLSAQGTPPIAGEYMDATGIASWYIERADRQPVQVPTPISDYGRGDMGYA